jgi:hypothetical protein
MVMAWLFDKLAGAVGHDSAIVVVMVGLLLGLAAR